VFAQTRIRDEAGQNLVEYALVVAMIGFGTVAGTSNVAKGINTAFNHVSSVLSSAT
jgi:pilus assembly protein Flp/PilA